MVFYRIVPDLARSDLARSFCCWPLAAALARRPVAGAPGREVPRRAYRAWLLILAIWMYATPVAYSAALIPERWQWLYRLNPMTGVVEGFRWALLGTGPRRRTGPSPWRPWLCCRVAQRAPSTSAAPSARCRCDVSDCHERHRHSRRKPGQDVPHRRARAGHAPAAWQAHAQPGRFSVRLSATACAGHPRGGDALGAAGTSPSRSSAARWWASSAATAPARARCSRSSRASPSRPAGGSRSTAASAACWRWAPASTPS